jgi:hypothetical protein
MKFEDVLLTELMLNKSRYIGREANIHILDKEQTDIRKITKIKSYNDGKLDWFEIHWQTAYSGLLKNGQKDCGFTGIADSKFHRHNEITMQFVI